MKIVTAIACALLLGTMASANDNISMRCRVTVLKEYRETRLNSPPTGKQEQISYIVAYEAFWWNCVAVRAAGLQRRCPFTASGTPAASAGARDGALNADGQIGL